MTAVLLVAVFTVQLQYGFSSIKMLGVTATGAQFGPPGYAWKGTWQARFTTVPGAHKSRSPPLRIYPAYSKPQSLKP